MMSATTLDGRFRAAVAAMDAGDLAGLERLLSEYPMLAVARLEQPGQWLRDQAGDAVDGFFKSPYLLWFIAADPDRGRPVPRNAVALATAIIAAARQAGAPDIQTQLDYALRLVCWSVPARATGLLIDLVALLVAEGAGLDGRDLYDGRFGTHAEAALYNGNDDAARFLLARGAPVTLSAALCLGRWADADRLLARADAGDKADAFVLAAMKGKVAALRRMLALGISPDTVSLRNQSHAGALHHAVWSRSLAAVKLLVEAGGDLARRDTIYKGTPLDWALHGASQARTEDAVAEYRAIADYLRR
ncbi:MAG: hypothetical protein AB7F09_02045 [Parvibaculaceae bacterium]